MKENKPRIEDDFKNLFNVLRQNFKKIFPSRKDASLIDKRIKNFVRITRRKTPYSSSELSDVLRYADKLGKLGVAASLASLSQPFKQTVPVMASTLINAGTLS